MVCGPPGPSGSTSAWLEAPEFVAICYSSKKNPIHLPNVCVCTNRPQACSCLGWQSSAFLGDGSGSPLSWDRLAPKPGSGPRNFSLQPQDIAGPPGRGTQGPGATTWDEGACPGGVSSKSAGHVTTNHPFFSVPETKCLNLQPDLLTSSWAVSSCFLQLPRPFPPPCPCPGCFPSCA